MSQNQKSAWLVAYDISDPRRLARVFKALKEEGIPLQYSVFSVSATPAAMAQLMARLKVLINVKEDDVRAYQLPPNGWRFTLGEDIVPPETWLL